MYVSENGENLKQETSVSLYMHANPRLALIPVWKKSIGKYSIQYFFLDKVLEIREKSILDAILTNTFFHTGRAQKNGPWA